MNDNLLDKFTSHFKKILIQAQNIAWQEESAVIEPVHLLEAMLQQKGSVGLEIMRKQNFTAQTVAFRSPERLNLNLNKRQPDFWNLPQPSNQSQHIIEMAVKTSFEYQHKYVGSEHLLASIIKVPDEKIKTMLTAHRVNVPQLLEQVETVLRSTSRFGASHLSPQDARDGEGVTEGLRESVLELFTTDLTTEKIQKDIDPVIGRAEEINRLIQILSRRHKNNPILLGDPGVGKTAIIEGLAKKITNGDVPDVLANKRILTLDLAAVIAGTMYRGEFENRLKQIIDEVKDNDDIILFIDEIHNIIGTGSSNGSLDAANILKPALARGQLRCIGATTHEEYKKFIENDKALERRFQPIVIEEATEAETLQILKGVKKNYEDYHRVAITNEALKAAVDLSQRYITDKKLPDKAIDLIDEAASQLKVTKKLDSRSKRIKELDRSLKSVQETKREFILNENYNQALNLKDQEDIILQELHSLKSEQDKSVRKALGTIDDARIAEIVSQITHIPLTEIVMSEKRRLLNLEKYLNQHIFGQSQALKVVAETVRRARAGLSDPKKPLGSFMFLGPSGVGKTETAKQLSRFLFKRDDALIRIDMSEFAERFNVSKLIGAPAGYVGYKEGNLLTDAVKKKPYSVILFDEVEKAHPDVFNILLQVLEDGHLTDAAGKQVNFKNTIIIMTSNIGLKEFNQQARLGFTLDDDDQKDNSFQNLSEHISKGLKDHFRPEFLNRLDKIVIFKPLNQAVARKIALRELHELNNRLAIKGVTVTLDDLALDNLVNKGFAPQEGARSLKRAFQEQITNRLAHMLLSGEIKDKQKVKVAAGEKELIIH